jgi:hypothetical protein
LFSSKGITVTCWLTGIFSRSVQSVPVAVSVFSADPEILGTVPGVGHVPLRCGAVAKVRTVLRVGFHSTHPWYCTGNWIYCLDPMKIFTFQIIAGIWASTRLRELRYLTCNDISN